MLQPTLDDLISLVTKLKLTQFYLDTAGLFSKKAESLLQRDDLLITHYASQLKIRADTFQAEAQSITVIVATEITDWDPKITHQVFLTDTYEGFICDEEGNDLEPPLSLIHFNPTQCTLVKPIIMTTPKDGILVGIIVRVIVDIGVAIESDYVFIPIDNINSIHPPKEQD